MVFPHPKTPDAGYISCAFVASFNPFSSHASAGNSSVEPFLPQRLARLLLLLILSVAAHGHAQSPPPEALPDPGTPFVDSVIGQIGALSGLSAADSHGNPFGVVQVARFKVAAVLTGYRTRL